MDHVNYILMVIFKTIQNYPKHMSMKIYIKKSFMIKWLFKITILETLNGDYNTLFTNIKIIEKYQT